MAVKTKNLVIVESPAKAKTLSNFLGQDFKVDASLGHIRDLPKSKFGIEIQGSHFEPTYIIPQKAKKTVSRLRKEAEKAPEVILATDEDREGEAIAWHLLQALNLDESKTKRIAFHEITPRAINEALKNPRKIDLNLVDSQQARRLLDRLVGYKLSPFLWQKVARGLSAGRVQSVALRLICEREKEIKDFKPEQYFTLEAIFRDEKGQEFSARLFKINEKTLKQLELKKELIEKIQKELKGLDYKISNYEESEQRRWPLAPFTTSTLQQEAFKRLHFSAKLTMMIAQHLYEGVEINGSRVGLITYMRTDSTNLASEAIFMARNFIQSNFGKDFLPAKPNFFKNKSRLAQEAHEAIRPTNTENTPEKMITHLSKQELRLYELIFRRFIGCQMTPAILDNVVIDVESEKSKTERNTYYFRANGMKIRFPGFLKMWPIKFQETQVPKENIGDKIELKSCQAQEHFTEPPPRYTDASLVKTLEKFGIGRPSTYAPTIATLIKRNYVERNKSRQFEPTEIGVLVNDVLVNHFPKIVDYEFTSKMEEELDEIAQAKKDWQMVLGEFYVPFEELVERKKEELKKSDFTKRFEEPTDEICEKCGSKMVIKLGRFGKFLACSNFPECKNAKPLPVKKTGLACPECKIGELVERKNKRRQKFYGCSRYPECSYTTNKLPENT